MEETTTRRPKVQFSAKEKYGVEISPSKNISLTQQDFQGEFVKRSDLIRFESDYEDIIAGPYHDPLMTDSQLQKQKDKKNLLKADDLYLKFTTSYPTLKKKALQNVVDQSKVSEEYENIGKSMYQMNFCKTEVRKKKPKRKGSQEDLELPSDWIIPKSIQATSFRNLTEMQNQGLLTFEMGAKPFKPPPNSLGFTKEEHEILQTATGETDYQESIGNSARDILKEAFYGEIKPLPHEFNVQLTHQTE